MNKNFGETIRSKDFKQWSDAINYRIKEGYDVDCIWHETTKVLLGKQIEYCARVVKNPIKSKERKVK